MMHALTRRWSDPTTPPPSAARSPDMRDYGAINDSPATSLDLPPPPSLVSPSRRRSQLLRSFLAIGAPPYTRGLVERGATPVHSGALRRALTPGYIVPGGRMGVEREEATLVSFDAEGMDVKAVGGVEELRKAWKEAGKRGGMTRWVSAAAVCGRDMRAFLEELGVPGRVLDDAAAGVSRAKVETYAHAVSVVAHVPVVAGAAGGYELSARQVAVVMVPERQAVVSLQSGADAVEWQEHVIEAVTADVGGLRKRHVAHLVCAMLDAMLESYFVTLEHLGNVLDELEWQVLHEDEERGAEEECWEGGAVKLHTRDVLRLISRTKHELGLLRRQMWPMRECLTKLAMTSSELLPNDSRLRVRESLDRTLQVLDVLESYRDVGHSLLDLHLAAQNNRMQEVMQTLAVVTTLFVPLTFLAGIEGMNFKNQPELSGRWSYVVFWVVVAAILAGQVVLFRRKGWI